MDAHGIEPKTTESASKKLSKAEAKKLIQSASRIVVAKGKKVQEFKGGKATADIVAAMLGPTGNLRAPTVRVGKTVLVGFNPESYEDVLS